MVGRSVGRQVGPGPRRRWARRRLLASVLVVVLMAVTLASSVLFVWPAADRPQHVDAVLSLDGPDEKARESRALSLVREGYAHVLLFSVGAHGDTPCPRVRGVEVVCFVPVPGRTVGEVEYAVRYARKEHWRSLMIVPGHAQATRARLLMGRCFGGRVVVVPAPVDLWRLPFDVVYEWGALGKALLVDRQC